MLIKISVLLSVCAHVHVYVCVCISVCVCMCACGCVKICWEFLGLRLLKKIVICLLCIVILCTPPWESKSVKERERIEILN